MKNTNTSRMSLFGAFAFGIILLVVSINAFATEGAVYGPEVFVKAKGNSGPTIVYFDVPYPEAPYALVLVNGEPGGKSNTRANKIEILINGLLAVGAHNFSGKQEYLSVPVSLEAQNELSVKVSGSPNSYVALEIVPYDNTAPIADAGPDQTVSVGSVVTLDGSGSSDIDGDALSHQWQWLSIPVGSQAELDITVPLHPTFMVDLEGTFVVQLIVNDGKQDSQADAVSISTENSAPVADAGPDQSLNVGDVAYLDGSASSDVDGDPISYSWILSEQPDGSQAVLWNAGTVYAEFDVDLAGTYRADLTVNDGVLNSAPDSVLITTRNSVPVADAGPDQTGIAGLAVLLDGSNSYDADGDTLSFDWSMLSMPGSSLAVIENPSASITEFVPDFVGDYVAQIIVHDGEFLSNPDTVVVQVSEGGNLPPFITSTPVTEGTVDVLWSYTVTASDPNGDMLAFSLDTALVGMTIDPQTGLAEWLPTVEGSYPVTIRVSDGNGGEAPQSFTVTVSVPPPNTAPVITSSPTTVAVIGSNWPYQVSASDTENDALIYTLTTAPAGMQINGISGLITWSPTVIADYLVALLVSDGRGGEAVQSFTLSVIGDDPDLPPDPRLVAPTLDPTVVPTFIDNVAFIYTGANPIQTGVVLGAIEERRVAVVRGQVRSRDDLPLSGVSVSVKDHPEYGQTLSRTDGKFDLVVNGGGLLVLDYHRSGYLSAQRQVDTPWRAFIHVEDLVMVPLDSQVTVVDLNDVTQAFQVAQGSMSSDADGDRQATVFYPRGLGAVMTLEDGSTQNLTTISARATEYTVGPNGPETMPAPLPPSSGYTYAVELSADEAIAAGATRIDFDRPIPVYVDNFLGFPVGETVPVGWYDFDKSAWVASENGKVISVLAINDGLADLDVDGSGQPASQTVLDSLGISSEELEQIAQTFSVGSSLWRVQVEHLTPWDCNWPYGPPEDAIEPKEDPEEEEDEECPGEASGCVIEIENQVLGEDFTIVGTPYNLHYRSNRVPGRKAGQHLRVPLTGDTVPASLEGVDMSVQIAGQLIEQSFPAEPNLSFDFLWDGLDGFGREVTGSHGAVITVKYRYPLIYYSSPIAFLRSFGLPASSNASGNWTALGSRESMSYDIEKKWYRMLRKDSNINSAAALGGLSIDEHHYFDPVSNTVYKGDGRQNSPRSMMTISTFAGNGEEAVSGDGGLAVEASIGSVSDVAVGPDGSLYIANDSAGVIRKVSPNGTISIVAGTLSGGSNADGIPATDALLDYPTGLDIGPDGSLYIVLTDEDAVRKVTPDGIITTVLTANEMDHLGFEFSNYVIPNYQLLDVAVADDGTIYVSDGWNSRVVKKTPSGDVVIAAGIGIHSYYYAYGGYFPEGGYSGDGGPAEQAYLDSPRGLAIDNAGSLIIAEQDNNIVRKVSVDGTITTLAGTGAEGYSGDGGAAIQATFDNPYNVTVADDDAIYVADAFNYKVRKFYPGGVIDMVAGGGGVVVCRRWRLGYQGGLKPARSSCGTRRSGVYW